MAAAFGAARASAAHGRLTAIIPSAHPLEVCQQYEPSGRLYSGKTLLQDRRSVRHHRCAGARLALLGIGVSDARAAEEPCRAAHLSQARRGDGLAHQGTALRRSVHHRRREEETAKRHAQRQQTQSRHAGHERDEHQCWRSAINCTATRTATERAARLFKRQRTTTNRTQRPAHRRTPHRPPSPTRTDARPAQPARRERSKAERAEEVKHKPHYSTSSVRDLTNQLFRRYLEAQFAPTGCGAAW